MEISKVFNNNVAVVLENNEEKIVMGREICFKKKNSINNSCELYDPYNGVLQILQFCNI